MIVKNQLGVSAHNWNQFIYRQFENSALIALCTGYDTSGVEKVPQVGLKGHKNKWRLFTEGKSAGTSDAIICWESQVEVQSAMYPDIPVPI